MNTEILLLSRDNNNWLYYLPNDIIKQILDYFSIPSFHDIFKNPEYWKEYIETINAYLKRYYECSHKREMTIYKDETSKQLLKRIVKEENWIEIESKYSFDPDPDWCWRFGFCGGDEHHECDKFFYIPGTDIIICENAYDIIDFDDKEEMRDVFNSIVNYYYCKNDYNN